MESNRQQKVANLFQEELAEAFRKEAKENYPGVLLSVTEVKVSPDLSFAKVFISIFPTNDKDQIISEIKANAPKFRGVLSKGSAKNMRITPDLVFVLDNSFEEMEKIDKALKGEGNNPKL